jgi:SagB-type dehydrogenase family enzyme
VKNPSVRPKELPVAGYDYELLERIKLSKPVTKLTLPFSEVISNRRSFRKFRSVTKEQLGELLWYTAKVKSPHIQDNGYILTHRGAPSAGARHPIDIIIYTPNMLGNENFYYYNPFDHSLNQLVNNHTDTAPLIDHVSKIVPIENGTLLWFVAHENRTAAKYEHPESLIWRDSGALINSIQLTCTALSLNSCPIGSLGEPYISDFFGGGKGIFGTGGIIIG